MIRRRFSREYKLAAVGRLQAGETMAAVSRDLEVHPSDLYRWRREAEAHGARAFSGPGRPREEEARVAQLERKVGQQALEIDFLKGCLQRGEEQRMLQAAIGNPRPTRKSKPGSSSGRG